MDVHWKYMWISSGKESTFRTKTIIIFKSKVLRLCYFPLQPPFSNTFYIHTMLCSILQIRKSGRSIHRRDKENKMVALIMKLEDNHWGLDLVPWDETFKWGNALFIQVLDILTGKRAFVTMNVLSWSTYQMLLLGLFDHFCLHHLLLSKVVLNFGGPELWFWGPA